jgi:hypothetical protein
MKMKNTKRKTRKNNKKIKKKGGITTPSSPISTRRNLFSDISPFPASDNSPSSPIPTRNNLFSDISPPPPSPASIINTPTSPIINRNLFSNTSSPETEVDNRLITNNRNERRRNRFISSSPEIEVDNRLITNNRNERRRNRFISSSPEIEVDDRMNDLIHDYDEERDQQNNEQEIAIGTRLYEVESTADPLITEKLNKERDEEMEKIKRIGDGENENICIDVDKEILDIINLEKISVKDYISEDTKNHIVIRDYQTSNSNYYIINKEDIRKLELDADIFACNKEVSFQEDGSMGVEKETNTSFPLFNMNKVMAEFYVYKPDIDELLQENNEHPYYFICPTKTIVPSTSSRTLFENHGESYTGANHCQSGKGGIVYRLVKTRPMEKTLGGKKKTRRNKKNINIPKSKHKRTKTRKHKNRGIGNYTIEDFNPHSG